MDKVEFDKFADEYQPLHAANIAAAPPTPAVLDFGTGIGTSVPFVRKYLPRARLT